MSELAVRTETQLATVLSNDQLKFIANTEFVPKGLRGNLPAILACVATGRAIGIDDMSAIRSIHIIDGKPTFSAELMVMLVRRRGHSIVGEVGDGSATVTGRRADNGDEMRCTWTIEMAKRAGLASKGNWKSYPEAMLWARAVSQLCRMLFADCFAGATYTAEELGEEHTDSAGEPMASAGQHVAQAASQRTASEMGELASPADDDDGLFPPPGVPEGLTDAQVKKLNVLVGSLRTAGHITTEMLWQTMRPGQEWPRDVDGVLHWAPLRDSLSKDEASGLIERLSRLEGNVKAAESAPANESESDLARMAAAAQAARAGRDAA